MSDGTIAGVRRCIPVYEPDLSGNELKYVQDCVASGWISSLGKYVTSFEEAFAAFSGARFGVAVCNGTAALHLSLAVLDIGPGDEVILPTLTFVATANAVRYTGATPVLVDSTVEDWTINPGGVEASITARTRAIIAVHLYGQPADLDSLEAIAKDRGIPIVEDAAEAHGAEYRQRPVGGIGRLAAFSFYANKIVTTGEGGMITTNDVQLAERARFLRDHAMSTGKRYWHPEVGFNYRMTNLQAAVGVAQLERIRDTLDAKARLATSYRARLSGVEGITLHPEVRSGRGVYWMYSILVEKKGAMNRDRLMGALRARGIETRPFFVAMHQLPPYRQPDASFPVASRLARTGLSLPSHPTLGAEDIAYVSDTIRELYQ